jgi:hypothetical protein
VTITLDGGFLKNIIWYLGKSSMFNTQRALYDAVRKATGDPFTIPGWDL